ncbi:hypothetical protein CUC08_Gglean000246 [Neofusicoccum parvum]|nr:hypothetical protein CUC08_Gglean000246 [Neofusicoccum parvum]
MDQSSPFAKPPFAVSAEANLSPFKISVSEEEILRLKKLLELSTVAAPNWENSKADANFGVSHNWLTNAVQHWQQSYNWREWEEKLNSFPQYTIKIEDDGNHYTVHFLCLFSTSTSAVPIVFLHGWPGSVLEFLPMLLHVRAKYPTPDVLPYHVIVPHLVGFGYSSPPPLDRDFGLKDNARIVSKLMHLLGFADDQRGYVAQGGDVGSAVAPETAGLDPACRLVHVNMIFMPPPDGVDVESDIANGKYTDNEVWALQHAAEVFKSGSAYSQLQGTRPATAGFAIGSNPISLLAWIGEKMLQWCDSRSQPSLDFILTNVSLYWFSGCYPSSIWPYRMVVRDGMDMKSGWENVQVPMGYSWFKYELLSPPRHWLDIMGKVKWYRAHDKGGHFAALEQPKVLWEDVTEFVNELF